ncbi:hypothetical protein IGI37_000115 [Enterococcus sp. AZ194]|uniref:helix-turn-helix transcriptional regulator n=1 Tax=Enterococcus sp. AZ194 TaxID=2774629 RepID=UPI003F2630C2
MTEISNVDELNYYFLSQADLEIAGTDLTSAIIDGIGGIIRKLPKRPGNNVPVRVKVSYNPKFRLGDEYKILEKYNYKNRGTYTVSENSEGMMFGSQKGQGAGAVELEFIFKDDDAVQLIQRLHIIANKSDLPEPFTLIYDRDFSSLMSMQDVALELGISKQHITTNISRGKFPEPVKRVASGNLWTRDQIEKYKEEMRK